MRKFAVEMELGNAAFEDGPQHEIARILRELASKVEAGQLSGDEMLSLRDSNGNRIGFAEYRAR